ncbi:GlcNAc-PI de-N-acetylase [Nitzschia inconspicua]|uniref:GlcNAc-PI de-N-acetylase n=1 Tax=Nitzschia inconspicua TaxID=303405 RepID=A0A9K3LRN4_9STRA|nr:GlcNAc-PI de-N-acetylase [Nitzschia inconspicua]
MSEKQTNISANDSRKKLNVLTVGDGNLTLSLALARAYGEEHVTVTASVLEATPDEHLEAFPDAPYTELQERNVSLLYGVDATQLHVSQNPLLATTQWDLISFHHPHLGLSSLMEGREEEHAEKHHQLLCHYLYSASQIATLVHVCLCGTQPQTWKLFQAADKQYLTQVKTISTAAPFSHILWALDDISQLPEPAPAQAEFTAPRRYRNGKLGSRHFLGKYGYQHRRTEGHGYIGSSQDMRVAASMHYVFATNSHNDGDRKQSRSTLNKEDTTCFICGSSFVSRAHLDEHRLAPARPDFTRSKRNIDRIDELQSSVNPASSFDDATVTDTLGRKEYDEVIVKTVKDDCHEKRLRWFLQHKTIDGLSKRRAGSIVHKGLVVVNGEMVCDDSRILHAGDQVTLFQELSPTHNVSKLSQTMEVHYRSSTDEWIVVWKPAGMRNRGDFPGTLEKLTSEQEGTFYHSITAMEASCPGFCLMRKAQSPMSTSNLKAQYHVTVLVHGKIPDDWYPSKMVCVQKEAKWREKKRQTIKKECGGDVVSTVDGKSQVSLTITPLETTLFQDSCDHNATSSLSTLLIVTPHPASGILCHFLRTSGFPVVGDKFCRKEYMTLKRSIRNRLKDKLCLGCYAVEIEDFLRLGMDRSIFRKEVPEKLSAKGWGQFLEQESFSKRTPLVGLSTTKKIYVLVIAHPDDESMFFLPTIQCLKREQPASLIWLLCLTNGNYDGLGSIREKELLAAGNLLKIDKTIIQDNPLLQDHPTKRWDKVVVASAVRSALVDHLNLLNVLPEVQYEIILITFDEKGISGHRNHIDTYLGVSHFMVQQGLVSQSSNEVMSNFLVVKEAWKLHSESNVFFKYFPVVSWLLLILSLLLGDSISANPATRLQSWRKTGSLLYFPATLTTTNFD